MLLGDLNAAGMLLGCCWDAAGMLLGDAAGRMENAAGRMENAAGRMEKKNVKN